MDCNSHWDLDYNILLCVCLRLKLQDRGKRIQVQSDENEEIVE